MKLRPHQKKQNKAVRKALKKHSHILYGAPTGFGKSVCILDFVERYLKKGKRVLVMAPYRKLVFQLADTFSDYMPAILMGTDSVGIPYRAPLVLGTKQTINARLKHDPEYLRDIDIVLVDEAHLAFGEEVKARYWSSAKWIGFSATPITANGYRLEGWDKTIYMYDTAWLIDRGWLAQFDYYNIKGIDTSGLRVQKSTGDYVVSDVEQRAMTATAVESVVKEWKRHGKGKKTLIFAASIRHAELLAGQIEGSKVIHSELPEHEIRKVLNGSWETLINVAMLTTGFDDPAVEVLMIARPTASIRLAIQIWGRALRMHPDIPRVRIVDLCDVTGTVCLLPNESPNWNRTPTEYEPHEDRRNIGEMMTECPNCNTVFRIVETRRNVIYKEDRMTITSICPYCENVIDEKSVDLRAVETERILTVADIDIKKRYSVAVIRQMIGELVKLNTRNAKTSWAVFIYKRCVKVDKKRLAIVLAGWDQKIFSARQAWKRLMEIYDSK